MQVSQLGGGDTGQRHPIGIKPSPAPQGSRSTAGKPQAFRESPALPVPVSPSAAGSTRIPQPWGTPRLWPRPLVGPGEGRAEQTRLEPRESPRREGAGAWTRLAPTPRSHQQQRDPGGNDPTPSRPRLPTQHPIPGGGVLPRTPTCSDSTYGPGLGVLPRYCRSRRSPGTRVCTRQHMATGTPAPADTRVHALAPVPRLSLDKAAPRQPRPGGGRPHPRHPCRGPRRRRPPPWGCRYGTGGGRSARLGPATCALGPPLPVAADPPARSRPAPLGSGAAVAAAASMRGAAAAAGAQPRPGPLPPAAARPGAPGQRWRGEGGSAAAGSRLTAPPGVIAVTAPARPGSATHPTAPSTPQHQHPGSPRDGHPGTPRCTRAQRGTWLAPAWSVGPQPLAWVPRVGVTATQSPVPPPTW